MEKILQLLIVILAVIALSSISSANSSPKISADLLKSFQHDSTAPILVSMKDGTLDLLDNLAQTTFTSRVARSTAVYNALRTRASTSQSTILPFLNNRKGVSVTSYWITNQIGIKNADLKLVKELSDMQEVLKVELDAPFYIDTPVALDGTTTRKDANTIKALQWGINITQAPAVWSMTDGTDGAGVIVANIDTGVRVTHDALHHNYLGGNHSWYDAEDGFLTPSDRDGHGTHTMGSMVGNFGYGMAPGASWIACKAWGGLSGANYTSTILACGQFILCPTDPYGNDPDCSKAPHVVSNSWSWANENTWVPMINAWHAAGIIPVKSNGNSGPSCSSTTPPAGDYIISVGSTTSTDSLASSSSLGPNPLGQLKPTLSAPGASIVSAYYTADNAYATISGTSMACPHVAGAIALLLSKNPSLDFNQIISILQSSADTNLVFRNTSCGGIPDNVFPNNHFGAGRLNAYKAYTTLLEKYN